ncbi:DoxX family protein [Rhodococcoides trifolii]|uniref:DoxX family protein n=1 Tax=Rhodococcoides trifolii TaxID=908250 RepID=UPI00166F33F1|nr:DoxX family protein [Rhodococcus trifolii]
MSEKPKDTSGDSAYEGASSPYDQPTEKFPPGQRTSVPRTEDELSFGSTSSSNTRYRDSSFADPDSNAPTTNFAATSDTADTTTPTATRTEVVREGRGTTDLGLLVLRVTVGAIVLVHGLQKLTGAFNGPGLGGFEDLLTQSGFDQPSLLALLAAIGETAGGALLILGLATPFAAASVVAVMINAWCFKQTAEPGLQFFAPTGVEYETLLGIAAGCIALTGPGRIALDGGRKWSKRPFFGSVIVLLLGIAGGVTVWILLNGANPLV